MKKLLCLMALLVASVSLVGCVITPPTQGPVDPVDGKTQITFWHAMGQANQAVIQQMIDSFEKAYPMFDVGPSPTGTEYKILSLKSVYPPCEVCSTSNIG